jgi:membrane-bound lytic murein transglycosylase A
MKDNCFLLLLLVMLATVLPGCANRTFAPVAAHSLPDFIDDCSRASLEAAVEQSINFLQNLPADRELHVADQTISVSRLISSLLSFAAILHQTEEKDDLRQRIAHYFDVYQARRPRLLFSSNRMMITGYFEPELEGSLTREAPFLYPLYRVPPDLIIRPGQGGAAKEIGRMADGQLLPYWTRAEIEDQQLLAGQELVFLADPIDAFILQVQGSGKIRLRDGSVRNIHYAAANGRQYRSIGRLLVEQGVMPMEEVDLPSIKQYLTENPGRRDSILHYNESYIFFQWEQGDGPIGSLGEALTAGRSVAADLKYFPSGGLGFLMTEKPVVSDEGVLTAWAPMSRFVLVQDSGSAIVGPGRLDFFWGRGRYAEIAAGAMKHEGRFFILLEKGSAAAGDTKSVANY